ncbi:MAG: transposase [Rubrivivax sp.]|nr:transposase [Rubrivivax sp.]
MAAERVVLRRRHSAELKTLVLEQCAAPGASVAKVAMSHGVNANIVHGWRKLAREREGAAMSPPSPTTLPAKTAASVPQFVPQFLPVSMAQTTSPPAPVDIQIDLRRGATAMKITWPIAAAAECAAWMRELLR